MFGVAAPAKVFQPIMTSRNRSRRPHSWSASRPRLPASRAEKDGSSLTLVKKLFSLDTLSPLRYITPMPPPTPLPVLTALIGLFRQGFWRRLAGRLFRSKASQQAEDAVEDFLLPILEAIAKIAAAVQDGTYREPEYAPEPPDESPETSGWTPPPKRPKPPKVREPEPPWLSGPIRAAPRAPRPPPAPPEAERPSAAPPAPSPPQRQRPSWPPFRAAARPPLPPPGVRIPPKKARPKPVTKHAQFVPYTEQ